MRTQSDNEGDGAPGPALYRRVVSKRLLLAALAVVTITLAIWMAFGAAAVNDVRASVTSLFVGLSALVLTVLDRRPEPPPPDPGKLADDLAATVNQQWRGEAKIRDLRDPQVLPLVWTRSDSSALFRVDAASFDVVTGQLAKAYRSVPAERLVVLGEPGAGKSVVAMLLTLGLLADREAGSRVPVLLNASSWDPVSQDLREWIVTTLAGTYYGGQRRLPQSLVDNDLVVPVLDGLDEIPETSRRIAIRRINEAIGAHRPIIVTCRSAEYTDVLRNGAPSLHEAPVVTVQPVSGADLATYLELVGWPEHVDWKPVLAAIEDEPGGHLAAALSTPLMISVARAVYRRSPDPIAPSELLDRDRFGNRHAIEDHLVDGLVTASFDDQPERARRWLVFLAAYLHRHRERDLSWWRMPDRLLSPWSAPAVGLILGLLFMIGSSAWFIAVTEPGNETAREDALGWGTCVGAGMAILATVLWFAGAGALPSRLAIAIKGSVGRLRAGFLAGVGIVAMIMAPIAAGTGVVVWLDGEWTFKDTVTLSSATAFSVALAVVAGAGVGVHALLKAPPERSRQMTPAGLLAADRWSSLIGALAAGAAVALIVAPMINGANIAGTVTGESLAGWAGLPGIPSVAAAEGVGLDRQEVMVSLICGLSCAALVLLSRAWARFQVLHAALALRGRMPWRLMAFLAEAHRRDLLRESGGVYQFRHIRLQERLAEQAGATPGSAPTAIEHAGTGRAVIRRLTAIGLVAVLAISGWSVNAMRNHLRCRPASAMPAPAEQLRVFTADGSWCSGVVPEGRWDTLGPPRAPGTSNPWQYVFDRLRTNNGSADPGVPVVAVSGWFSDPDPTGFEYAMQQLSGVVAAQTTVARHAKVVLFDTDENRVDSLLDAWRKEAGPNAVIQLGNDQNEGEVTLPGITENDPSAGTPYSPIQAQVVNGAIRLASDRQRVFLPLGPGSSQNFLLQIQKFDNWTVAGAASCPGPSKSAAVYSGPARHVDEFLTAAQGCPTLIPLLIGRRSAVEHLLRQSARTHARLTFYYVSTARASTVADCPQTDRAALDAYWMAFPGQGEPCTALLGGSAVLTYRALDTIQRAAKPGVDQAGLEQQAKSLLQPGPPELTMLTRVTADARTGRWKLESVKL